MPTNAQNTCTLYDNRADAALGYRAAGSRYPYDATLLEQGWQQYDTDQDAWYFGVWVHLQKREIFTYAEGDRSMVQCATPEAFAAELVRMAAFYGDPPPAFSVIDAQSGTLTHHVAPRPGAGL